MENIVHSVRLDKDKCKGCTNCIKMCPTQAIRVRNKKAKIIKELCIDCGECIRVCPYHAKKAVTDSLDILNNYKYKVALPAPAFYSQFSKAKNIDSILNAFLKLGFDDVYEVAFAAQIITAKTKELLKSGELESPAINSACPAVTKLIAARYPNLINNIIPLISPMILASFLARKTVEENTNFKGDDIGIFFITPCAAKATCTKYPVGYDKTSIDGVFSFKDIYLKILPFIKTGEENIGLSSAGFNGVCWANSGGEVATLELENYIAVDGIHNVMEVLEEIENGKLEDVSYVEALACTGGCVGGPLTVENNFVAKTRLKKIAKTARGSSDVNIPNDIELFWNKPVITRNLNNLDEDISVAMDKLRQIEVLYESMPKLDCGSCGSPTCMTLAEDIVKGYARETECIFKLREKVAAIENKSKNL